MVLWVFSRTLLAKVLLGGSVVICVVSSVPEVVRLQQGNWCMVGCFLGVLGGLQRVAYNPCDILIHKYGWGPKVYYRGLFKSLFQNNQ